MTQTTPKVFISYSWSPISNKNWVKDFAERLSSDGIHVVLDIWDLKEGHDKYHFMEQMVNDEHIKKVLLICNKEYCTKSNMKKGGVGTESMIISSEIYSQVNQDKFIPIIREYNELGKKWIPTFMASRLYIDLSSNEYFESEYERLVRNIYEKPLQKRPPIGDPPKYLDSDEPVYLKTAYKVREIKQKLLEGNVNVQIHIDDYCSSFIKSLDDHIIENMGIGSSQDIDENYILEIEKMRTLRDDYIDFIEVIIKFSSELDSEKLQGLWQNLVNYSLNYEHKGLQGPITTLTGSHIQFFLEECFLYTIAIALKYEAFRVVSMG